MPIVINELHIKATVNEQGANQQQSGNGNVSNSGISPAQNAVQEQVKKSVDAILDILKRKNER